MTPLRILNAEPLGYSPRARTVLESLGQVDDGPLSRAALLHAIPRVDVLVVRLGHRVDEALLAAAGRLRAVVTATTGLDHVDVAAAEARGVHVLSLRGETEFLRTVSATAEHTWALLLALLRHIPAASEAARRGRWERDAFRGRELDGRTLGIVGLGRIGTKVARYGRAFGMRVRAYDPYLEAWPGEVDRCHALGELLEGSDVLAVLVPSNEETRHLIGAAELARLPEGAFVVNTARGAVVDGEALVDALRSGHLGGAAADVVEGETSPEGISGDPLVRYAAERDDLLLTPHIGGATLESMEKTEIFMAQKLVRFFNERG